MQRLYRQIRISTSKDSDKIEAAAKMIIPCSEITGGGLEMTGGGSEITGDGADTVRLEDF